MELLKACSTFLTLAQRRPGRDFSSAVAYYEQLKNVKLSSGPAGTMGQIFFVENDPNQVVKFTTDKSEAMNMQKVKEIQSGNVEGFTEDEINSIKNNVIKVNNVFVIRPKVGNSYYVIEQEKGKEVPLNVANKIMFYIGTNISKQPNSVFPVISKKLSEPATREELSNLLTQSLLDGKEIGIDDKVDVGDLGLLLSTIRKKIDDSFKDFRASNMVTVKENNIIKIKLIDLGYGTNQPVKLPEMKE
jgi:hypothetical protein